MRHHGKPTHRNQQAGRKFADEGDRHAAGATSPALPFAALFCGLLLLGVWLGRLGWWLPAVYALVSLITFIVYARDKHAARRQRWRTQEKTLHLLALFGGWPGALLAQRTLRHKSSKTAFQTVFWGTVALNCGLLGWLVSGSGGTLLQQLALISH